MNFNTNMNLNNVDTDIKTNDVDVVNGNTTQNKTKTIITLDNYKKYLFKFDIATLEELFLTVSENNDKDNEYIDDRFVDVEFDVDILDKFSFSDDVDLRYYVAKNKNTNTKILGRLNFDKKFEVRIAAIYRLNISKNS